MTESYIPVVELVGETERLFPQGYLRANPDLFNKFGGNNEDAAVLHFEKFGRNENRKQFTRDFYEYLSAERRRDKFERFRECFTYVPEGTDKFPVIFGNVHEDISQYESESAHPSADIFTAELEKNPDKLYADVGAGLRDKVYHNCIYVEVYPSITTDVIIEPNCELPFQTASLDGIGCFAVLEHVQLPWKMAMEFARVIKPGGKVFIDWPFLAPLHGYPSHFFNASREGIRSLFEPYFSIDQLFTGMHQGPDFTVNWVLSWLRDKISDDEIRSTFESLTVSELIAHQPRDNFWRRVLETLDDDAISTLSCGNRLIGSRRVNAAPAD